MHQLSQRMSDADNQQREDISVSGNYCSKGVTYAKQETTIPQRVLTILMRPEGAKTALSVKTDRPVPKASAERMCESGLQYSSEASGEVR